MLGQYQVFETLGTRGSGRRLGAWAASEGEPKPTRGSWKDAFVLPGTWCAKTLKSSRMAKDMRGASEPVRALASSGLTLLGVR